MTVPDGIPVQAKIEAAMDTYQEGDRWESIVLFSSEGLPMAGQGTLNAYGEGDLLQFAFSLIEAVRLLCGDASEREVLIRGNKGKILSFHYFKAWNEPVILAAVASPKRGYRRAVLKLIRYIQNIR
jgi:hypothetical protein